MLARTCPCFATAMEPRASGMEVPAASTVMPMATGGIFSTQPTMLAQPTMNHESRPIHRMDAMKLTTYLRARGRRWVRSGAFLFAGGGCS